MSLRVLHLTDRLTDRGGAHWHLLGVLRALGDAGDEVHLAAGRDEGVVPAPCPLQIVPGLAARTRADVDLEALARELAPDLVHLHTVVNPAALEWAAGRPSVITVQDHRYFCPARGKWTARGEVCGEPMAETPCAACFEDPSYFRALYDVTAGRLRALRALRAIVLSSYMKAELTRAGLEPDRIAVVPPFVHGLDGSAAPAGPRCVLFVGRLTSAKGVREAVEAWHASGVELPLVFAGTGPLRAWLEAAALEDPRIEVLGWVDHGRLGGLYRRAAALLMPSRWQEPFGIAGLEALSLGTPVVAWDSGGIRDWHPGGATLVRWGDVAGLARALREAVGTQAVPPVGFERAGLMVRLRRVYEAALREAGPVRTPV